MAEWIRRLCLLLRHPRPWQLPPSRGLSHPPQAAPPALPMPMPNSAPRPPAPVPALAPPLPLPHTVPTTSPTTPRPGPAIRLASLDPLPSGPPTTALLYSDTELSVRVGTIKSAADTRYLLQSHVDMVISLCPLTPMEGTPQNAAGWQSQFADLCIEHLPFPHRDTRNLRGENLRVEVASLRCLWGNIFYETATARWRIRRGSGHLHIPFHCFASINRSTAAAIAFLMQECIIPLRVLISKLCQVRPCREYWGERDQFLQH